MAGPCKTCIKIRKAAFAVIRTVVPKAKQESKEADGDLSVRGDTGSSER
jgi:hypothetical protein